MRKSVYAICEQQMRRSAAHPRSLISAFVVRCLDCIIPLVSISKIASLYLASMAAQAGLYLTRSQTPKTGFLVTGLILKKRPHRESQTAWSNHVGSFRLLLHQYVVQLLEHAHYCSPAS